MNTNSTCFNYYSSSSSSDLVDGSPKCLSKSCQLSSFDPYSIASETLLFDIQSDDNHADMDDIPESAASSSLSHSGGVVISNTSSDVVVTSVSDQHDYAERDPRGRYIRFNERLGKGSFKTVYMAFDEIDGIEVAWNRVKTSDVFQSYEEFENVHFEVNLLKTLEHENIIKLYDSWIDGTNNTVNMITELFTSGSLRQYRMKHKNVDMKAIKNWARQILCGLDYLHTQNPPIIHRDLKCDNIFVNGHSGEIKIGDLGLATVKEHSCEKSIIGTPEFMAPELYEEQYNELVDIYSFGMCLLEMVTCEYPYSECNGLAEIYKKVTRGVKPASLGTVNDPEVKKFIQKCLVPASQRLTAKELLNDPFFQREVQRHTVLDPLKLSKIPGSLSSLLSGANSMDIDPEYNHSLYTESNSETPVFPTVEFQRTHGNNEFKFRGAIDDENTVELNGQIVDCSIGQIRYLHFNFSLVDDTALEVAREMVEQLELEEDNIEFIADFISYMITKILPGWEPPSHHNSVIMTDSSSQNEHEQLSKSNNNLQESWIEVKKSPSLAHYEDIESQDSAHSEAVFDGFYAMDENGRDFVDMNLGDLRIEKLNFQRNKSSGGSTVINDSQIMGSIRDYSSSSLPNKVKDFELKLEIDKIEAEYQHRLQKLMKKREEELKAATRKWMASKRWIV